MIFRRHHICNVGAKTLEYWSRRITKYCCKTRQFYSKGYCQQRNISLVFIVGALNTLLPQKMKLHWILHFQIIGMVNLFLPPFFENNWCGTKYLLIVLFLFLYIQYFNLQTFGLSIYLKEVSSEVFLNNTYSIIKAKKWKALANGASFYPQQFLWKPEALLETVC